ncbi:MAG TPA: hypothetical protein VGE12_01865 [Noviherbaspirillum sp.]
MESVCQSFLFGKWFRQSSKKTRFFPLCNPFANDSVIGSARFCQVVFHACHETEIGRKRIARRGDRFVMDAGSDEKKEARFSASLQGLRLLAEELDPGGPLREGTESIIT